MEAFETIRTPTREDLERAANRYFEQLRAESDQPLSFSDYEFSDGVAWSIEQSESRIADLDNQLRAKIFDPDVTEQAQALMAHLTSGVSADHGLSPNLVHEFAARAERERWVWLIQRLTSPTRPYAPQDTLFSSCQPNNVRPVQAIERDTGPRLADVVDSHIKMKRDVRRVKNQIEDTTRVLHWLMERVGADAAIATIDKSTLRAFRDDVARLSVKMRGRATPFNQRLTDVPADQIKSATARRYWGFVRHFLAWAESEGLVEQNAAATLEMPKRTGESRHSPERFSTEEIAVLLSSPLFQGHRQGRWSTPGDVHRRDQHWWSALLLMHTGMRASELAQLEFQDFSFEGEVPAIHIRREGKSGKSAKAVKSAASVRQVPIAPVLLELGLRPFVERQKKRPRVFDRFRFGTGRASDGLSKFWSRYLHETQLWKLGRSTHVWRHTFIARLRDAGIAQEDIAALVGHEQGTITATYGGSYSLARKRKALDQLNFGLDLVTLLGGPYEKARHG